MSTRQSMTTRGWRTPKSTTTRATATTIGFWLRAVAFFAKHGITVREVLSDNGPNYRSGTWTQTNHDAGIQVLRTQAYRPQTNGKVERFQRTLRDEWGYAKACGSESARRNALTSWLHIYNHHRPHTALGGKPPVTRVTNLPGRNKQGLRITGRGDGRRLWTAGGWWSGGSLR